MNRPPEPAGPPHYEPVAISAASTVVAEFTTDPSSAYGYQSEAELERELIAVLGQQAYEHLVIASETDLIANLRRRLEALNGITFSDVEWQQFFTETIAGERDGIVDKTELIQEDHVQLLRRDDGTTKNVTLIDKANIHNNHLQVVNQYEASGSYANRYDVTILVNGLPMVHIELKRRGVDLREAFNQINRYQRHSFWAGSGLFEYVQLFVISNGTLTKYYSNTTRTQHLDEAAAKRRARKTSNSYDFTSWWADATNKPITDLIGFTKTFLAKHTLLNVLTRYCVLTADRLLLVMRPYQIVATERIVQRIEISSTYKQWGSTAAGGYVWHTTGSGKTLTSFKTAQLVSAMAGVDKVLFVVDRKDLDYQTVKEYDRFQKGSANSNDSTAVLKRQLEDPAARIIVTTIQKLSNFVAGNKGHGVYDKHIVIVFDECHRSQFGDMHTATVKAFKRYHLFGFTGTPIFADNAPRAGHPQRRTTEQTFGDKLHTYSIVDAITDKNVLPFRIDYVNTIKLPEGVADKSVNAIDTERALLATERIRQVVAYILEHFDQKTRRAQHYSLAGKRVNGFNSLFATASIEAARAYYNQFFLQQQDRPAEQRLKVAVIYSYSANEQDPDGLIDDESFDTESMSLDAREFLDDAIADYNDLFGTRFDTSANGFHSYYVNLSQRLKDREIDLVIVVNMFLTGFDATTLNTLWVDKNLRAHGLLQAYSRTNRILNSVKSYGNIVSFRNLEDQTNDALALFGNKDAGGIVVLKPYADYYEQYSERVDTLLTTFPLGQQIVGEAAQKAFISFFGAILRLRNILVSFDDFAGNEILTQRQVQDYQSIYLDLYQSLREQRDSDKESIIDDVVFEIELIKQVEINVDYILMLVEQLLAAGGDGRDIEIRVAIDRAVDASPTLRSKKDLIEDFIESVSLDRAVDVEWQTFIETKRRQELDKLIADEGLNAEATYAFVERACRDGAVAQTGVAITRVMPPLPKFGAAGRHSTKKRVVLDKLTQFFERFAGLA